MILKIFQVAILFQVKLVEILNILYNCSFSAKTYPIKVLGEVYLILKVDQKQIL